MTQLFSSKQTDHLHKHITSEFFAKRAAAAVIGLRATLAKLTISGSVNDRYNLTHDFGVDVQQLVKEMCENAC